MRRGLRLVSRWCIAGASQRKVNTMMICSPGQASLDPCLPRSLPLAHPKRCWLHFWVQSHVLSLGAAVLSRLPPAAAPRLLEDFALRAASLSLFQFDGDSAYVGMSDGNPELLPASQGVHREGQRPVATQARAAVLGLTLMALKAQPPSSRGQCRPQSAPGTRPSGSAERPSPVLGRLFASSPRGITPGPREAAKAERRAAAAVLDPADPSIRPVIFELRLRARFWKTGTYNGQNESNEDYEIPPITPPNLPEPSLLHLGDRDASYHPLCHGLAPNGLLPAYSYQAMDLPAIMVSNMLAQDSHLLSGQLPTVSPCRPPRSLLRRLQLWQEKGLGKQKASAWMPAQLQLPKLSSSSRLPLLGIRGDPEGEVLLLALVEFAVTRQTQRVYGRAGPSTQASPGFAPGSSRFLPAMLQMQSVARAELPVPAPVPVVPRDLPLGAPDLAGPARTCPLPLVAESSDSQPADGGQEPSHSGGWTVSPDCRSPRRHCSPVRCESLSGCDRTAGGRQPRGDRAGRVTPLPWPSLSAGGGDRVYATELSVEPGVVRRHVGVCAHGTTWESSACPAHGKCFFRTSLPPPGEARDGDREDRDDGDEKTPDGC
ncbi:TOX high mobility group box family member 2 [Galemys pyrenaicus]|uniref:TOX high mobility group box family member 2 n=1 Tax=Galemys pyrenaicus TaxID=202257 RepID=A0A8J6DMN4_GALPY|nr:TOX high mobility group box family member 2 [Galemys pyrenaicus]